MSTIAEWRARLRGIDLERVLGLRPPWPPVAVQVERGAISLVRLKPSRRAEPLIESLVTAPSESPCVPATIFESPPVIADLVPRLGTLFERSGTRPGRVSLVLPDNLAKISLLSLPERPASKRQLDELVRARTRRGVPFKLDEGRLAYQVLPGAATTARGIVVLVVVVRRSLVEQYERALGSLGARVGLVDLFTPNLINLCRGQIAEAGRVGDVAVLNCDENYFSLAIIRGEQLIFLRCKTFALAGGPGSAANGVLLREISNSFSYYQEKLQGKGVRSLFVRSLTYPVEEIGSKLEPLGLGAPRVIEPLSLLRPAEDTRPDPELARRLAPALGAAGGRSR